MPRLDPRRFPLERAGDAHGAVADGSADGRIVVDIDIDIDIDIDG